MKIRFLKSPPMIDPRWLREYQIGRHDAVVGRDGMVQLGGVSLPFNDAQVTCKQCLKMLIKKKWHQS